MVDLALLESVFLVAMGGWLIVLGGAFLLSDRTIDRVSSILLSLAGVYAILWQQPALLGFGEAFHVALAQPVFLGLLSGAIFLWTYWLFERHVERLEDAMDELGSSLSVEQTLVDVLSHDLRNTITAAHVGVQQIAKENEDLAGPLKDVEGELDKAAKVMDDGLVYSRLANEEGAPLLFTRDVTEDVQAAVDACRDRAEAKGVTIDVESPSTLVLEASPLVERAVENLVDNAVKFSPEDGTVRVEVDDEGTHVRLSVGDEGPGIPPDQRERVRDRFVREADDGVGLGLAIVGRVVDLHDGRLEIGEAPGGGARVEMLLPASDDVEAGEEPAPIPGSDPGGRHA